MSKIQEHLKTKQGFITLIYILFIVDIAYRIFDHSDVVLDWQLVVILGILTFAILGDRISELIINKDGVTLKQNIDIQVYNVMEDTEAIQSISKSVNALDGLLGRAESADRDVWTKLIIYRLTLRAIIRQICTTHGMSLGDTTSLTKMINFMKGKEIITTRLEHDLNFIKKSTFFLEWGTRNPPTAEEIRRVLSITPSVLKDLKFMIENKSQSS